MFPEGLVNQSTAGLGCRSSRVLPGGDGSGVGGIYSSGRFFSGCTSLQAARHRRGSCFCDNGGESMKAHQTVEYS